GGQEDILPVFQPDLFAPGDERVIERDDVGRLLTTVLPSAAIPGPKSARYAFKSRLKPYASTVEQVAGNGGLTTHVPTLFSSCASGISAGSSTIAPWARSTAIASFITF